METVEKQNKQTQSLIALIFILIVITLGLSSYIIVNVHQEDYAFKTNQSEFDFLELSSLISQPNLNDIAFIAGVKDLKLKLSEFSTLQSQTENILTFVNKHPSHYVTEFSEPIVINSGFRLLFNFDNQNTDSQLIISGKENLQDNQWWENIHQLRIGYNNEEKGYYVSLLNGQKPNSIYYQIFKEIKRNQTFILKFNNEFGSSFSLLDLAGNTLTTVNLLEKKYQMPVGLFPYQSLQIGVNLPPKIGKLTINKFYLYEFR